LLLARWTVLLIGLLTGVVPAAGCAPFRSRPLDPAEAIRVEQLQGLIAAQAARSGHPMDAEVVEELDEAGLVAAVHGPGVPLGAVSGGTVYLHEDAFQSWHDEDGQLDPTALQLALVAVFHEGVHLTQSWWTKTFSIEEAEREAYQQTHRFHADLLEQVLVRGQQAAGLEAQDPLDVVSSYKRVHQALAKEEVGDACARVRLRAWSAGALLFAGLAGRPACVYEGRDQLLDLVFESIGGGKVRGELVLELGRPEVEAGTLVTPRSLAPRPGVLQGVLFDPLAFLPGFSDVARLDALSIGWYLAAPTEQAPREAGDARNHAPSWNLRGDVVSDLRVEGDRVLVRLEAEGAPGTWRLGFTPLWATSYDPSALEIYRPLPEEGAVAGVRLASLQRRALGWATTARRVFVYYDRRPRTAQVVWLGPVSLVVLAVPRPWSFAHPADPSRGFCLPGWRDFVEGSQREGGGPLDVEVLWEPGGLVGIRPHRQGLLALGTSRAALLVPTADLSGDPLRYRLAVAWGVR
jgi:hypothetical protein